MREKQCQAELQSCLDQLTKEMQWNIVDQFSVPAFSSLLVVTADFFNWKNQRNLVQDSRVIMAEL
jgi:hypothetical protein